ncbi:MAG: GTP cyclohydrolase 1 [Candidatus Poribacteria bacterium]|nr:MAG: GTP cyclohydrolase 1 [Candidatus Poribacteria bacterium]
METNRYEAWDDRGEETGPRPWETPERTKQIAQLYESLLIAIGEDPRREGLLRTPIRAARAIQFLTQGYQQEIESVLNDAIFEEPTDGIVIVRDIEFYSLCEHHVLPFFGRCHVAYLPDRKIIGLSKIPRLVDMFARRLQVQERLTRQIAEAIQTAIQPRGVAVVTEAAHMCMMVRGVEKQHSSTVTSYVLGAFREDPSTRVEFFNLIQGASFRIE